MVYKNINSLLTNAKPIGEGANGTVFLVKIKNKLVTVKMVMWAKYMEELKLLNVYNSVSSSCKTYFPKPVNIGLTKVKYRNRYRGLIAYEYIEGEPFRKFIKNPENAKHIPKIMNNIRKALLCMWNSGYIHGDLHLDNILVAKNKSIKIIDFSTSKQVTPLSNESSSKTWFKRQWKKVYKENLKFNPNFALYNWKVMNSPGIWAHEKNIIKTAMLNFSSIK